ncbi:MAG: TolC family protein [Alistipes sp.]|nr:TolC family protein [Alistipes sp.]
MRWLLSLRFMLIFVGVQAQERLSFDEALSRMVLNNRAINGAKYGVDAAYSEYRATQGLRAPQVELMGGYTLMQHDIDIDLGGAKGVVTESLESLINKGITGGVISPTIAALLGEGLAPIHSADWSYTLQKRDFGFVGTTISVPIYLGGRINIANRVAKLKVESANNLLEGVSSSMITELVERYYGVILAQEVVKVREEVVEGVKQHLADALAMEEEGMLAHSVILYLEYKLSDAERDYADAKSRSLVAELALQSTLQSADDITPAEGMFITYDLHDIEYYRANALQHNPIIGEAHLAHNIAVEGVNLARGELLPSVVAMGGVSICSHNLSDIAPRWAVGIGASIPLFAGFSGRQRAKSAQYTELSVESMAAKATEDILLLVDREYYTLQNALLGINSSKHSETFARSYYHSALEGFRAGVTSSVELMDARIALAGARVEYLSSVYDYTLALARLLELSGLSDRFMEYKSHSDIVDINTLIE